MDYLALADALAAPFDGLAAPVSPAGLLAIREATGRPPGVPGELPAVYVVLDRSGFETGNGTRAGGHRFRARFLLQEAADLGRDAHALAAWAGILADLFRLRAQLGGLVARVVVAGVDVGLIPWAGRQYAGIDVLLDVTTAEAWLAAAG